MDENSVTLFLNPYHLGTTDAANELIQDAYGTIAEVNKSLLTDNHIQSKDGIISVSNSLYASWFAGFYKKNEPAQAFLLRSFMNNIDLILSMKAIIYSDSRLFMAKLPFTNFLCLGTLLKAWECEVLDYPCPKCKETLKLLNIICHSLFDESNIAKGYCFNCHRIIRLETESFDKYDKKFREAKKLFRIPGNLVNGFTFEEAISILKYLNEH